METDNPQLVIYQAPQEDTRIGYKSQRRNNLAYSASDCGTV